MHRIDIYTDRNDNIVIDFYYEYNDLNPERKFVGKNCSELFSLISSQELKKMRKKRDEQTIVLMYDEYFVNIKDYKKVLSMKNALPLKEIINQYCDSNKTKKVIRENKYAGKRIVASALALVTLGSVMYCFGKKKTDKPEPTTPTSYTEQYEPSSDDFFTEPTIYDDPTINDGENNEDDLLVQTPEENEEKDNSIKISIAYEDRSDTEKARKTQAWYGDIIEKYAKRYGLDPRIVIAIATQERGVHSEKKDSGGATGLMQIQNSVWRDKSLTAYNFETNSYETIVVDEDSLGDVFYNIKVGCMYFQNCMDYMNNNVLAAIQCYNMGYGSMMNILKAYSSDSGKNVSEVLEDVSNCCWLEYRDIIKYGDQAYLENVLSWIGAEFSIDNFNLNGEIVNLNISNESEIKSVSIN